MSTAELEKLLDTAEYLFYERGYQAVGMDEIRSTSGLSLKRIYALVGNKEQLAVSMLRRRDDKWHADLKAYVDKASEDRHLVAIFDWLYDRGLGIVVAHGLMWRARWGPLAQRFLMRLNATKSASWAS